MGKKKHDITKIVITVGFKAKDAKGKPVGGKFPVSLQQWIKKTPEQQDAYVAQHTKHRVIEHNVID
jgi:hypothetical protein